MLVAFGGMVWCAGFFFGPRHFFTAWLPGGGEARYRVRRWGDTFTWVNPADKTHKVVFPLDQQFARAAKRGLNYTGDVATGLLLKWDHHKAGWLETDGRLVATKLGDGRELNLANATKQAAYGWLEPYILPLAAGALVALIVVGIVVWKVWRGQGSKEDVEAAAAVVRVNLGLF